MSDIRRLLTGAEGPFATGAAVYEDSYPETREAEPRIYVRFRPHGVQTSFLALLDTGAHYLILNQDISGLVQEQLTDYLGETVIRTAYGPIQGGLFVLRIEVVADIGEHLDLDVITFISPDWQGSSFIGYTGVLDRFRFGIDPLLNGFFFGCLF